MNETQWLPGIVALAVALVGAGIYLLLGRRKSSVQPEPAKVAPHDPAAQAELDRRAQSLLDAVREHKESRHQHTEEEYASELRRLELEAAAALRARDEGRNRPATAPATARASASTGRATAEAQGLFGKHPALKGAAWASAVILFFVGLGFVLSQEEKVREDGMEASGRTPPSGMPQGLEHDHDGDGVPDHGAEEPPVLARALARLEANPNDLDAAGEASHFLIQMRRLDEAEKITLRGLAIDPFASELRVHRAVIRGTRGDTAGAREELQLMVDLYPGAEEGLLFLGSLAMMEGNKAEGLEHFERFAVEVPADLHPPELMAALTELRREIRGSDAPPATK